MSRQTNSPLALQQVDLIEGAAPTGVHEFRHPLYSKNIDEWTKWRLTYDSGPEFKEEYLERFSKREKISEFETRKRITYVTPFAAAAVDEVIDSFFQRLVNVNRSGGPDSYVKAIAGNNGGVDLQGSSINAFIGQEVLPELAVMTKVGVFVDSPADRGLTLADQKDNGHPYLYIYRAEDILNWVWMSSGDTVQFKALLLRDIVNSIDEDTGLPKGSTVRYRYFWTNKTGVWCQFYNSEGKKVDAEGRLSDQPIKLNTDKIPFVLFELTGSIMKKVADYQIALMNLESSDLLYSLRSNVPFYVEQYNPLQASPFIKSASKNTEGVVDGGEVKDSETGKTDEVVIGSGNARRYPKDLDQPAFIHPSSEPLKASMDKGAQIKADIRILVKLSVQNLAPRRESAESKGMDERSLEAGLSAIGLVLETGERRIGDLWAQYEGSKDRPDIRYPRRYNLKSSEERQAEAKTLKENLNCPSLAFKREATKIIVRNLIGDAISQKILDQIETEIDKQEIFYVSDADIQADIKAGVLSLEGAEQAKNYPKGEVKKAATEHADRVARIVKSQASARGASDMGAIGDAPKVEKTESLGK